MPAVALNISSPNAAVLPTPLEPPVNRPGLPFAKATSSGIVFADSLAFTASTQGMLAMRPIGAKSLTGS